MDDAAAVSEVLDERPELESPLRDVLEVDEEHDSWSFNDLPVDSGEFGELVSRGLVEKIDDGSSYQVANPDAVRSALGDGDSQPTAESEESGTELSDFDRPDIGIEVILNRWRSADRISLGALLGALLVVVVARAYVYGSVFRDGGVVLSGNDPYYYRYWVEQALAASGGALDVSSLATMSNAVQTGEPLLVATLWFFSSLLGGDATAAGWVLAWYPVVAAVVTAYLVYRLTMVVTDDHRVALAAVLFLAVTPAHAFRTSLGFADHHAFDYVWLMITAYALVRLDSYADAGWRERRQWVWAGVLGLGIGGQILAWDAGPLLIVPLAGYVALRVLGDVRDGRAPFVAHLPVFAGVVFGTLLVYLGHVQVGWHSETVAFSPVLLTLAVLGVLVAGELAHRYEVSMRVLAAVEVVGGVVGLLALRTLRPGYWSELMDGIGRITASRNIAETQSLLSGDTLGWLLLFGFVLALAVPFLVWESIEAYRGERGWLVPVVYGWYFLLLAMYQVRFAGQLAMFTSVFAGLGFVYLASAVDLTEKPMSFSGGSGRDPSLSLPSWGVVGQFVVLFLLVAGLSVVQVPIKTSQIVTDGDQYRTAAWMNDYAAQHEWEYPQNYVFSQWGKNRMYNYFVNGESQSYGYAQQYYASFLESANLTSWYEQLNGRAGFILTKDGVNLDQATIYNYLHDHYGSQEAVPDSIGRFRAVYETPDGSYKVFSPVKGALVAGRTSPNETGIVRADIELPESTFTYERQVSGAQNGWYMLRVPYPVKYDLPGNDSVNVSGSDIANGSIANQRSGNATWPLTAARGRYVFDKTGGNHGYLSRGDWRTGENWTGLYFNGSGNVAIPDSSSLDGSNGFTLSVRFKTGEDIDYEKELPFPRIVSKAPGSAYRNTDGYQIVLSRGRILGIVGNGTSAAVVSGERISNNSWYEVTLTWNGSTVRLYVDGQLVDSGTFTGSTENDQSLAFGSSSNGAYHFVGSIDAVSYRNRSINPTNVGSSRR